MPACVRTAFFVAFACILLLSCSSNKTTAPPSQEIIQVSNVNAYVAGVSADGQWLALDNSAGIAKIASDGTGFVQLATQGNGGHWSWTNDRIVLEFQGNLIAIDADGGNASVVRSITGESIQDPQWSQAGDVVVLDLMSSIFIFSYPDGDTTRIQCNPPAGYLCDSQWPSLSPDGQSIAVLGSSVTTKTIMKVNRASGASEILFESDAELAIPRWSPDSKWIAFAQEEGDDDVYNIWVVDARGESFGIHQLTDVAPDVAFGPVWSPDSKAIYFTIIKAGAGPFIYKTEFNM